MELSLLISGFQRGADLGGILGAVAMSVPTGGTIPRLFANEDGLHPEYADLYNAKENWSSSYKARTIINVQRSDGTLRFASDFNSPGEICTLNALKSNHKPYLDVYLINPQKNNKLPRFIAPSEAAHWVATNHVSVLNVAGNRESTCPGIEKFVKKYIEEMIAILRSNY